MAQQSAPPDLGTAQQLPLNTLHNISQSSLGIVESLYGLTDASKQAVGASVDNTLQHLYLQEPAAQALQVMAQPADTTATARGTCALTGGYRKCE